MPYAISYVPPAAKAIRKLGRPIARRLLNAIESLASDPRPAGCLQLKGGNGEFRIRVGEYRIGSGALLATVNLKDFENYPGLELVGPRTVG